MEKEEQAEKLFKDIKDSLDITWEDEQTNKKIKEYITDGIELLQNDVGSSINFSEDIEARKLLKTYCRYARNNSEEYFIDNNLSEILKLEVKYAKDELQQNDKEQ